MGDYVTKEQLLIVVNRVEELEGLIDTICKFCSAIKSYMSEKDNKFNDEMSRIIEAQNQDIGEIK